LFFLFFPEGKVLLEKLNDGFGVSEGFFVNIVYLFQGIRQRLFTEFACLLVVVHHLVVEHREVQSKSKSDWVACIQAFGGGLGELIVLQGSILDGGELVSVGALSDVSVVVSDHLVEEGLGLVSGSNSHAGGLDDFDDGDALVVELTFDLFLIPSESIVELLVLGVLLDGGDGSNGSSLGTNLVFESY
jgi:hypothetical protein